MQIHQDRKINQNEAMKKLLWVSLVSTTMATIEIAGGYYSGAISIWSEAAHFISDFLAFFISLLAVYLSGFKPTKALSYGYHRCEVIGAFISILLIWGITAYLLYEAIMRVIHNEYEIKGLIMLIAAIVSFCFNLILVSVNINIGSYFAFWSKSQSLSLS